ncbi:MAG: hypothetical protein H6Q69_514 [Firmicutes bacterium]|nr:hypothetical protein [Bacillota bacterium]
MSVDTLIQEDLVNFRRTLIEHFKAQHPQILSILEYTFSGHENIKYKFSSSKKENFN